MKTRALDKRCAYALVAMLFASGNVEAKPKPTIRYKVICECTGSKSDKNVDACDKGKRAESGYGRLEKGLSEREGTSKKTLDSLAKAACQSILSRAGVRCNTGNCTLSASYEPSEEDPDHGRTPDGKFTGASQPGKQHEKEACDKIERKYGKDNVARQVRVIAKWTGGGAPGMPPSMTPKLSQDPYAIVDCVAVVGRGKKARYLLFDAKESKKDGWTAKQRSVKSNLAANGGAFASTKGPVKKGTELPPGTTINALRK